MFQRRRALTLTFAVGILMAAIVTAVWTMEVPSGGEGDVNRVNDTKLSAAADVLDPLLRGEYPDSYAGMSLDHDGHFVNIYQLDDPSLTKAAKNAVPDIRIVFHPAKCPLLQMERISRQITDDLNAWSARGLKINSLGPRPDGTGVEVSVSNPDQSAEKRLRSYYNTDAINVVPGDTVVAPSQKVTIINGVPQEPK